MRWWSGLAWTAYTSPAAGAPTHGRRTALIAIGGLFLVLTGVVVTLAVSGVFDEVNRDDYSGDEAEVAEVIDRFEQAYENSDGARMCREVFSADLTAGYDSDGGCETIWSEDRPGPVEIDVRELYLGGDGATVVADEENARRDWTFYLDRYPGTGWRISGIE
jgi:hypothetical protein